MWAANFVLVDHKLRGLFSILFGASMLLVIERARASGQSGVKTHYARMAVLLFASSDVPRMLNAPEWWTDDTAAHSDSLTERRWELQPMRKRIPATSFAAEA